MRKSNGNLLENNAKVLNEIFRIFLIWECFCELWAAKLKSNRVIRKVLNFLIENKQFHQEYLCSDEKYELSDKNYGFSYKSYFV